MFDMTRNSVYNGDNDRFVSKSSSFGSENPTENCLIGDSRHSAKRHLQRRARKSLRKFFVAIAIFVTAGAMFGIQASMAGQAEAIHFLGDAGQLENWSGLEPAPGAGPDGEDVARLQLPGHAEFMYPGDADWTERHGYRHRLNPAGGWSWRKWEGLALDVNLAGPDPAHLRFTIIPGSPVQREVDVTIAREGWHTVFIPMTDFRLNGEVMDRFLLGAGGLRIEANTDGSGEIFINRPRLQRGRKLGLDVPVKSRYGKPGDTIEYKAVVLNCSDERQGVRLRLDRRGGEVIQTSVRPDNFVLEPGESRQVVVEAYIPTRDAADVSGTLPGGARERWTLSAVPGGNADAAQKVELIHVVEMESPYLEYTEERWDKIRKLAETEDWAREQADNYIERARSANPPQPRGAGASASYGTNRPDGLGAAAIAWQLTGEMEFAEKVAEFWRGFADPERGYPATKQVLDAAWVQEGGFFRYNVWTYDAVRDAGVFSAEDIENIEAAFRIYLDIARSMLVTPCNFAVASTGGAIFAALAIQDWEAVEYFLEGPTGLYTQIGHGILDDGWWWEMSTGYNQMCASIFTRVGLALEPWGVGLLEKKIPAAYHEDLRAASRPGEPATAAPADGIYDVAWGPYRRNYRQIRDLWHSMVLMVNEEGKMFGINDANEERSVGGFEMAAYAFGDEEFLRHASGRNLLYPLDIPEEYKENEEARLLPSARADNAGVAMLRSQGVDSVGEQYQAVLTYGSHGGHHGHWDRLQLVYLRRFGRLATHTRTAWFSYGNFMYQMYVQTSMAQSMVVVDGKNQYPAPSAPLLYHTGDMFQAVAVENETRWSNVPFRSDLASEDELEEGIMRHRGHEVKIPEDPPEPRAMTEFTEPVRSRRLMAVTDDYVLVLDDINGKEDHTFDLLYQFRGFSEFAGEGSIEFVEEREKFDDSPLRAGQFVRNARHYDAQGPVTARFVSGYTQGDPRPRPEVQEGMESLYIDVHSVWPQQRGHIVSDNPQGWTTYSAARTLHVHINL